MRPHYHYAPQSNWLSDPNGLVFHAGEWHLFYQYNPFGEDWGHMSWGHAVSRDLAHWQELPVALLEDDQGMIFSGSAVIDHADSGGFGAEAMVALYTRAQVGSAPHQDQFLAWSNDAGRSWSRYSGNPVLDLGMADFRDPNVFWHQPSGQWIMVVVLSAENRALVYGSSDLRQWRELSAIDGDGAPGEVWECPLLIELPVEGGGTHWLFKVDALSGAPGSGALYCTGHFDGRAFVRDGAWRLCDWGSDFYAAIAWHEPRDALGRPLWIGWMGNHGYQGQLPPLGWRGAMSLPRRLCLRREGQELRLCQQAEPASVSCVPTVSATAKDIPAAAHLVLTGDDLHLCWSDDQGRSITLTRSAGAVTLIRRDPVSPFLDAQRTAALAPGVDVDLWLDAGSIEVLSADGALSLTMQHRMAGDTFKQACEPLA